jgi:predicted nucleic acid-binding protein
VSLLILDDRAARLEAYARGFAMMGAAALIALCKARGLIAEVRTLLEALRLAGYHLGDEVIAAVPTRVGESP